MNCVGYAVVLRPLIRPSQRVASPHMGSLEGRGVLHQECAVRMAAGNPCTFLVLARAPKRLQGTSCSSVAVSLMSPDTFLQGQVSQLLFSREFQLISLLFALLKFSVEFP